MLLVGCDRPTPQLLCHNGNCAGSPDPAADDTIGKLTESLALTIDGRPAIDGVEMDSFWFGAEDTCIFAHDLEGAERAPATDAAMVLADHLASATEITYSGEPFQVLLELKGHVGAETDEHSPAQLVDHAACAWDMYEVIAAAAVAADHQVEIIFSSFEPPLLRAIADQAPATAPIPFRFGGVFGIPKPLDGQTHPLSDYAGVDLDVLEIHAQWLLDGQYEAVESSGLELAFWMFSATSETFATIDQYDPAIVVTSEALLMRRWLEY